MTPRNPDVPPTATGTNRKQLPEFNKVGRVKMRLRHVEFWYRK